MRIILTSFLMLNFIKAYTQVNGIVPADSLYTPDPYVVIKSTSTDSLGNVHPFLYSKTEYSPRTKSVYSFIIISIKDGKELSRNYRPVPKQNMHKVKYARNHRDRYIKGMTKQDSGYVIDQHAWDSIYKLFPLPTDTIRVADERIIDCYAATNTSMSSYCNYKGDVKDGMEFTYYNMTDLKGVIVNKNFRLKSSGKWKMGKKIGTWRYYSPNGDLYKTEKWRNGKLIRSSTK